MAVYVDKPIWPWRGKMWAHLMADSIDELHAFAKRLGLQRSWFQSKTNYAHYDITESKRLVALHMGAIKVDEDRALYSKVIKNARLTMIEWKASVKKENLQGNLILNIKP